MLHAPFSANPKPTLLYENLLKQASVLLLIVAAWVEPPPPQVAKNNVLGISALSMGYLHRIASSKSVASLCWVTIWLEYRTNMVYN